MTTIEALRDGIRAMLKAHPDLRKLKSDNARSPDTKKVERYGLGTASGIGHESGPTTQQNVWVLLSAIRLGELADIRHATKPGYAKGEKPGRNSNLEQIPGFRYQPLVCFMPKTIGEARRVVAAVTGPWVAS